MDVGVGIVGAGNVGMGTLQILAENGKSIEEKLGFPLCLRAVSSRTIEDKALPSFAYPITRSADWRDVVSHPGVEIVVEAVGGTGTANQIIESALRARKSVVTANKELMALRGAELWHWRTRTA